MSYISPERLRQERYRDSYERAVRDRYERGQKITRKEKKASPYNHKTKKTQRATRDVNGRGFHMTTSGAQLLSLILIIGLIATVFFAYYNSIRTDGNFQYFSPAQFLENISDESIMISKGDYIVDFPFEWGLDDLLGSAVRGYVIIDGRKIGSTNTLNMVESISHSDLYFRLNNEVYTATWRYVDELGQNAYVLSLPDLYFTIDSMPDPQYLIDSWRFVSIDTVFDCIQETFVYFGDFLAYSGNILLKLLPWNSVAVADNTTPNLEQLWAEAAGR